MKFNRDILNDDMYLFLGYDEIYAPLFYNEYKQLFYYDYFIGE